MSLVSAHRCDIGRMRKHNDDYVWVDETTAFYIVADGMGGYEAGDIASRMTANTVGSMVVNQLNSTALPHSPATIKKVVTEAIETANQSVFKAAQKSDQKRKMGTTIVVALIHLPKMYISHAGDSRAYLVRDAKLTQLTEDDSWGAQFAAASMPASNGEKGRFDHFLTKSVGQDSPLDPSFIEIETMPGDWLLLCSDGLWNMISDDLVLAEFTKPDNSPDQVADALVTAANHAGGKDNISVIVIKHLA